MFAANGAHCDRYMYTRMNIIRESTFLSQHRVGAKNPLAKKHILWRKLENKLQLLLSIERFTVLSRCKMSSHWCMTKAEHSITEHHELQTTGRTAKNTGTQQMKNEIVDVPVQNTSKLFATKTLHYSHSDLLAFYLQRAFDAMRCDCNVNSFCD